MYLYGILQAYILGDRPRKPQKESELREFRGKLEQLRASDTEASNGAHVAVSVIWGPSKGLRAPLKGI